MSARTSCQHIRLFCNPCTTERVLWKACFQYKRICVEFKLMWQTLLYQKIVARLMSDIEKLINVRLQGRLTEVMPLFCDMLFRKDANSFPIVRSPTCRRAGGRLCGSRENNLLHKDNKVESCLLVILNSKRNSHEWVRDACKLECMGWKLRGWGSKLI